MNTLITLAGLQFCSNLFSQIPQPLFTHYTVEDGLPSSEVHHVMQDSKGYMWFATDIGVSRFDGYGFRNFSIQEGLTDNTIFNIYEDYKGRIWFISFSGRLSIFEDGSIQPYKHNHTLGNAVNNLFKGSFYVDAKNHVHIRTVDMHGYMEIDGEGIVTHYALDSVGTIGLILLDSVQIFSFSGPSRTGIQQLTIIKGLDTVHATVNRIDRRTNFQCISIQSDNLLFTSGRVASLISSGLTTKNYLLSHDALSSLEDLDQNVWIGTYQGGVLFYENGLSDKSPSIYLIGLSVTSITQDYEGGLWFTTLENGLYYLSSNKFLTYNRESGLNGDKVTCLASDSRSTVFAGLRNGTLFNITDSIYSKNQLNVGTTPAILTLYFDTSTRKLWVGAASTDMVIDRLGVNTVEGIGGSHSIVKAADGGIWMGNHRRLKKLIDQYTVYSSDTHQDQFRVTALHEDRQGTIWVGNLHGLWTLEDSSFISAHESDSLLSYHISDIDEINGNLCVATKGAGLILLRPGGSFQLNSIIGLASDNISDIFIDGNDMWLATNNGVNKVSIYENDPNNFNIVLYTSDNGLASNEVNQVMKFRNRIWAATNRGLTVFDPNEDAASKRGPNIYINGISIAEKDTSILHSYDIPYDQNQFTIRFIGLSYRNAGQLQYRLKMTGIDSSWVYTQNTSVRYTTIPPGSYTFQVSAMNHTGQWSQEPASFKLTIRAPFWETWWFRLGIALLLAAVVYAFFKIRILTYNRDVVRELMITLLNIFRKTDYLVVKISSSVVRINPRAILWIKAADNYVQIVTKDQKYLVRSTIDTMHQGLPAGQNFLKVHRSYIIHVSKVHSAGKSALKIGTETIPVSESYKDNLKIVKEHLLLMKK